MVENFALLVFMITFFGFDPHISMVSHLVPFKEFFQNSSDGHSKGKRYDFDSPQKVPSEKPKYIIHKF